MITRNPVMGFETIVGIHFCILCQIYIIFWSKWLVARTFPFESKILSDRLSHHTSGCQKLNRLWVVQHQYRTDTNGASSWHAVCRSAFPGLNPNRRQNL